METMKSRPRHNLVLKLAVSALWLGLVVSTSYAQDSRKISEPKFPQSCATLRARLSVTPDGVPDPAEEHLDTARIQEALDHCIAGRAVELTSDSTNNAFLTGPLELPSSVTLLVGSGVTLFASRNARAYDVHPGSCGTVNQDGRGCKPLISSAHAPHSAIMGEGVIDGQGGKALLGTQHSWWELAQQAKVENARQNCPRLVVADASDDFILYGITLRNSPNFHVMVSHTDGFTAWGVKIDSPATARNTDGIDPASSVNVTITHSYIRAGDDNVAIKAGSGGPARNITIAHNHFYSGHGMSIGSETNGGVNSVLVEDLTIDGADNGLRIKSDLSRGGLVQGVTYKDICLRDVKHPVLLTPFYSRTSGNLAPQYQDIVFKNVHAISSGPVEMAGLDSDHLVLATLDGVFMDQAGAAKVNVSHARITVGPSGTNFLLVGEDVRAVSEHRAKDSTPLNCKDAFVAFPEGSLIHPQRKTIKDEEPISVAVRAGDKRKVTVSPDGKADYARVQAGIDALAPEGGTVQILPGTYREVIHVAKPHVHLEGMGPDPANVVIVYANNAGSAGGTFLSATAFVTADDFVASNLTFENDFSKQNGQQRDRAQAVALSIRADRAIFRNVRFLGAQDTLFAASRSCESDQGPCIPARQFFQDCYIEGNVDFIFGDSKAVFDHCVIHATSHEQVMITAQSKRYPAQDSGYVFNHCRVTAEAGVGKVYLGRPWRAYATVVFLNTEFDEKVDPAVWSEWHPGETSRLQSAYYAEFGSIWPNQKVLQREPYSHLLNQADARSYLTENFLAGADHWNPMAANPDHGDKQ